MALLEIKYMGGKNEKFHTCISISRSISKSPRVATSSYAGEIGALFTVLAQLDSLRRF